MKTTAAKVFGALGLLYLVFPSLGVFELIPDGIPVIGNLDEAGATILLVNGLKELGYDLSNIFGIKKELPPAQQDKDPNE